MFMASTKNEILPIVERLLLVGRVEYLHTELPSTIQPVSPSRAVASLKSLALGCEALLGVI